jgi:MHS family proline/betaine transporter-like MFS transporter
MVAAASAGNALEFYDFAVFGYFTPQIAASFFPSHDPMASMLAAWGTFAVAFIARPFGAIWLGGYADRRGRKAAMTACILFMTLGTLLLTIMPGAARIGLLAPSGVLLARLLQGFAAGGEFGGATAFMLEHATSRRAFVTSFQFTSQAVGIVGAAGSALALHQLMPAPDIQGWGFRLPFAAGLLIGPVGLYLRRHADETPIFLRTGPAAAPVLAALRHYPGRIALGGLTIASSTALSYIVVLSPTYAQHDLHLATPSSYLVPVLSAVFALFTVPVAAYAADSMRRLTPMIAGIGLTMLAAYPAFLLVAARPSLGALIGAILVLTAMRSLATGSTAVLLGELYPPDMRGVGMSMSYALGTTIFGGTTPVIVTWMIGVTGNRAMPGLYLAVCSALSLSALLAIGWRVRLVRDDAAPLSISGGRDPSPHAAPAPAPIR